MKLIEKRKIIEVFDPTNIEEIRNNFENVIECPDEGLCIGNIKGICCSGDFYILKIDGQIKIAKKSVIDRDYELYQE